MEPTMSQFAKREDCLEARAKYFEQQRDELLAALKDALQFVSDHVNFGGKYPYINGTELVRDAYKVLKQIDEVIAKYES